jgi:hypothetical protein
LREIAVRVAQRGHVWWTSQHGDDARVTVRAIPEDIASEVTTKLFRVVKNDQRAPSIRCVTNGHDDRKNDRVRNGCLT